MPCPNCNHTVQNLGLDQSGRRVFWCPRCGTLKTETPTFEEHSAPRCGTLKTETPTFEEHSAPRWTKPMCGVPYTLRVVATLAELVNSAFGYDRAKELLHDIGAGEVYEAIEKTCRADGRDNWSQPLL